MKQTRILVVFAFLSYFVADGMVCPNGKDTCPSSNTCCILADESFGCCPFKNGQCCSDKRHCCPSGMKCNMEEQTCDGVALGIPFQWMIPVYDREVVSKGLERSTSNEELKVRKVDVDNGRCPGGNTCPTNCACCQMPDGNYGCCPYPNANCCSDKEHCCPNNYNCDMQQNRCIIKSHVPNFYKDVEPKVILIYNYITDEFEGPRNDGRTNSSCSNFVCPLMGFKCCEDPRGRRDFCCPEGTKCSSLIPYTCEKETKVEVSALDSNSFNNCEIDEDIQMEESSDVVCPDKTEACSSLNTCCQSLSGNYGCCPMPQATCCSDKINCCPNGYVCGEGDRCERKPLFHLFHEPIFVERSLISQLLF